MSQTQEPAGSRGKKDTGNQQNQRPLLSKLRNFNHFTLTSFGSLFSGNIPSKPKFGTKDARRVSDSVVSDSSFELSQLERGDRCPSGSLDINNGSQIHCTWPVLESLETAFSSCDLAYNPSHPGDCCSEKLSDVKMFHHDQPPNSKRFPKTAHTFTRFPEMRVPFSRSSTSESRFTLSPGNGILSLGDRGRWGALPQSINSSEPLAHTAVFPSSSSFEGSFSSSSFVSQSTFHQHGLSEGFGTPPLTPDSFNDNFLPLDSLTDDSHHSFSQFSFRFDSLAASDEFSNCDDSENSGVYNGRCLREIKEGKKPERIVHQNVNGEFEACGASDDPEEWYGLEYTLEVSSQERQPSESQSFCVGEHSKSRESWAALHRGIIHPLFEDEDYRQWKNWHRFLDHQDEKKRHKKGLEFKSRSEDLAWIYVDEIRTLDILYWQKDVFGVVAGDVKERLRSLVERFPDPYHPPQDHNWSWYLKRSRSVACLRELDPKPPVASNRRL